MVLAAVSQEADAQEPEEGSCPLDLPEGGWEEGQPTTRYCCKPIYWGKGPDLHRARARCQQTRCVLRAPRALMPRVLRPSPRSDWCTQTGCIGRGCSADNGTKCTDLSGVRIPTGHWCGGVGSRRLFSTGVVGTVGVWDAAARHGNRSGNTLHLPPPDAAIRLPLRLYWALGTCACRDSLVHVPSAKVPCVLPLPHPLAAPRCTS